MGFFSLDPSVFCGEKRGGESCRGGQGTRIDRGKGGLLGGGGGAGLENDLRTTSHPDISLVPSSQKTF